MISWDLSSTVNRIVSFISFLVSVIRMNSERARRRTGSSNSLFLSCVSDSVGILKISQDESAVEVNILKIIT